MRSRSEGEEACRTSLASDVARVVVWGVEIVQSVAVGGAYKARFARGCDVGTDLMAARRRLFERRRRVLPRHT